MECLSDYKVIIFDSDGVVFDSNSIKLCSFKLLASNVVSPCAVSAIEEIVLNSKGLTRYDIISLIHDMSKLHHGKQIYDYAWLLRKYSELVYSSLVSASVDLGIYRMREKAFHSLWFILTAGDEEETKRLYNDRGISTLFSGGIYGSPKSKSDNLEAIIRSAGFDSSCDYLMLGDSYSDAELAYDNGIDFALLTHWSNCPRAYEFCMQHSQAIFCDIEELAANS